MSNPDSAAAFGGVFRSESRNDHHGTGPSRKLFILLFATGVLLFLLAAVGRTVGTGWLAFGLANGLLMAGGLGWVLDTYRGTLPGIRNHGTFQSGIQRRRWPAWLLGLLLTALTPSTTGGRSIWTA